MQQPCTIWKICTICKLYKLYKICQNCPWYISIDPRFQNAFFDFIFETLISWSNSGSEGLKNAENTKNARYTTCGTVLLLSIEHIAGTRVAHYSVVSPVTVEYQIGLDLRAAISSLRSSDEQGVYALQALRECWSYLCLLLSPAEFH